jgi:hypothetical protein
MSEDSIQQKPPPPPPQPRHLRLRARQVLGLLFLFAFPASAMLGVTDTEATAEASTGTLQVSVTYPSTTRHLKPSQVDISVRNTGGSEVGPVTVGFDGSYLGGFTELTVIPGESRIQDGRLLVRLPEIQPDEAQQVRMTFRPGGYWTSSGLVTVEGEGERAVLPLRTLVLP